SSSDGECRSTPVGRGLGGQGCASSAPFGRRRRRPKSTAQRIGHPSRVWPGVNELSATFDAPGAARSTWAHRPPLRPALLLAVAPAAGAAAATKAYNAAANTGMANRTVAPTWQKLIGTSR